MKIGMLAVDDSKTRDESSLNTDDVSFRKLLTIILQNKLTFIGCVLLFVIFGVAYAISLPNIYRSDALLAPVNDSPGINLQGQLGGLAALAGVSIGGESNNTTLGIEVATSRQFLTDFIVKYDLYDELLAAESWNQSENVLNYDEDLYIKDIGKWVRKASPPFDVVPTPLEGYREFKEILNISEDSSTGFVTIAIHHVSPFIAHSIVENLISELNSVIRYREINESQKSIEFLRSELTKTENADAKSLLYSLIEEQMKTLMLANVRDEYVFKIIDKPIVPDKKISPSRALIVLLFSFIGLFLALVIVLVGYFMNTKDATIDDNQD